MKTKTKDSMVYRIHYMKGGELFSTDIKADCIYDATLRVPSDYDGTVWIKSIWVVEEGGSIRLRIA